MENRPSVSDEEIRNHMNFDSVVSQYKASKKTKQKWIRNSSLFLGVVGISVITYFNWPDTPSSTVSNSSTPQLPILVIDSVQMQIEPFQDVQDEIPEELEISANESLPSKAQEETQETEQSIREVSAAPSFQYLEAEPTEGYPGLYEYFARELRYPAEAIKDSIQGIVSVSFLIDQQGRPVQIKIVNSLGPAFDKEAQRLIENMPAWKPATLNGKPVAAKISLPFTFQILTTNPDKK